jgi:uncharacterized protein (TIGR03437 family)
MTKNPIITLLASLCIAAAQAQTSIPSSSAQPVSFGPIAIPATSVIFDPDSVLTAARLAGLQGGNGNHSPAPAVKALSFAPASGQTFTFSASGTASYNDTESSANVGPDGAAGSVTIPSLGSISGFVAPVIFPLVGVFTNGSPTGPAPANYDYSGGVGQATFAPLLNQVFFIGDGLTGKGSGSLQTFSVPATATELWIGFADAGNPGQQPGAYGDNTGSLTVSGTLNPGSQSNLPSITPSGVVPVYSTATTIQPGEFVSIYGTNLGPSSPAIWTGNFPTSLGGASVTIDGKAAYLLLVDSTQINLQAPDDPATGTVSVVVTTPNGTATSTVTLGEFGPSFSLLDGKHVAGIILRSDGSGAYGGGIYDIVGPTGTSLGYQTVAAKAGDTLELFGVGFGPTNPVVPAGQVYSGAAATTNSVQLLINNVTVLPAFSGLTSAGLYQLNVVQLPAGLGVGDVPLVATVGGVQTQTGVVISLQ